MRRIAVAGAALVTLIASPAAAQSGDHVIDSRVRASVVAGVIDSLGAAYVFPDSVPAIAAALRGHQRRGAYDGLTARAFADSLSAHLRAARNDGHFRVVYAAGAARAETAARTADSVGLAARRREAARRGNYGVSRVERLAGNVGYLALGEFAEPEGAAPVLAAAMTLLAHTDALVVDLRANGGGYPPTAALLASYLLGPQPVHLLSFYYRPTRERFDSWTEATVAGPRYGPERPVFVLTARGTASAAEAFTYTLRHLGRVTVVGDTTAGHAHPGRERRVGHGFAVFVPDGRPTSPVTKGNWEGTGVAPDLAVPEAEALEAAHAAALRTVLRQARDPERRREIEALLARNTEARP